MSFFKVPSFLRKNSEPNVEELMGHEAEEDEDDEFLVDRTNEDSSQFTGNDTAEYPPHTQQPFLQAPQSAQRPYSGEFPFPERYENAYEAPPQRRSLTRHEVEQQQLPQPPPPQYHSVYPTGGGQIMMPPPQYHHQQPQQQRPPPPQSHYNHVRLYVQPQHEYPEEMMSPLSSPGQSPTEQVRRVMAEGYSYEEAVRVLRYRQRNTYTESSLSFTSQPGGSSWAATSTQGGAWARAAPPASSAHVPAPPSPRFFPPTPHTSFYEEYQHLEPRPVAYRDTEFELAMQRSIEDEKRRRAMHTFRDARDIHEVEQANEEALQLALVSSFDSLDEERRMRGLNPWQVEQANEEALRRALQVSMYDTGARAVANDEAMRRALEMSLQDAGGVRRPPSTPQSTPLLMSPNRAGPTTKAILRRPSADIGASGGEATIAPRMSTTAIGPVTYPQRAQYPAERETTGGARHTAAAVRLISHREAGPPAIVPGPPPASLQASPAARPPAAESLPGSYAVSYGGGNREEIQSSKERSLRVISEQQQPAPAHQSPPQPGPVHARTSPLQPVLATPMVPLTTRPVSASRMERLHVTAVTILGEDDDDNVEALTPPAYQSHAQVVAHPVDCSSDSEDGYEDDGNYR